MDYYKCEVCKTVFDEFEMNYRSTQEDKQILCNKCRRTILKERDEK